MSNHMAQEGMCVLGTTNTPCRGAGKLPRFEYRMVDLLLNCQL